MNIVIPCAGEGSRFAKAGYTIPKFLINVFNKTMIEMVIENNIYRRNRLHFIFIFREKHIQDIQIEDILDEVFNSIGCKDEYSDIYMDYEIITIDKLTEGAACTVLKARKLIDNDEDLVIANSDQYIFWTPENFIKMIDITKADGAIPCFPSNSPKWSFCLIDENGWITQIKEKEVISPFATVGIYYFKHGSDFVWAADQMINKNIRTNNEFYVAPSVNELIMPKGHKFLMYPISTRAMNGLGTPEDLELFRERYKND